MERERDMTGQDPADRRKTENKSTENLPSFILLNSFEDIGHVVEITNEIIFSNQDIAMQCSNDSS